MHSEIFSSPRTHHAPLPTHNEVTFCRCTNHMHETQLSFRFLAGNSPEFSLPLPPPVPPPYNTPQQRLQFLPSRLCICTPILDIVHMKTCKISNDYMQHESTCIQFNFLIPTKIYCKYTLIYRICQLKTKTASNECICTMDFCLNFKLYSIMSQPRR